MSNNPIIKNDSLGLGLFASPPSVPQDAALVLYPHDSREQCGVYFLDDFIDKKQCRKRNFDRMAYVSLNQFQFQYSLRVPYADGAGQHCIITYDIKVSVRHDKESVRKIITNNIMDVSEPVIGLLNENLLNVGGQYFCLQYQELEAAIIGRIKELVSQITYLRVFVSQLTVERDVVSEKVIEDYVANELEKVRVKAEREKLERQWEEAEVRRKESEIERARAEKESEIAQIKRKLEMDEKQHEIEKKMRDLEAEKEYDLKRSERVALVAEEDRKLRAQFSNEELAAIDSKYDKYIQLKQETIDRKRKNASDDFDLQLKVIEAIKGSEMNDLDKDDLLKRIFNSATAPRLSEKTDWEIVENENYVDYDDISEAGEDVI